MVNPKWDTPLTPQEYLTNVYYRPPPPSEPVPGQMTAEQYLTNVFEMPTDGPVYDNPAAYAPRGDENRSGFPQIFSQSAPPAGWFTLNDYYALNDEPTAWQVQAGAHLPSTNDWRLLPPGYNKPQYFMINGRIIDRKAPPLRKAADSSTPYLGYQGGGHYPTGFTTTQGAGHTVQGYPGDIGGWVTSYGPLWI